MALKRKDEKKAVWKEYSMVECWAALMADSSAEHSVAPMVDLSAERSVVPMVDSSAENSVDVTEHK